MGKKTFVPKQYLAALLMMHKDEKVTSLYKLVMNTFKTNHTYRADYDAFIKETFELDEKKKIIALKNLDYENKNLTTEFPFFFSLENGVSIIKSLLGITDFSDYELLYHQISNIRFEQLKEFDNQKPYFTCGISQNVFDFVVAREYVLNKAKIAVDDIAQKFYILILCGQLLKEVIANVKTELKNNCLRAIKNLNLTKYDPRFEVNSLEKIESLSLDELYFYYGDSVFVLTSCINYFSEDENKVVPLLINDFLNSLSEQKINIIRERETNSLESVGKQYNLTRERIRQIEQSVIDDFSSYYNACFCSNTKDLIFVFPKVSSVFPLNSYEKEFGEKNDCFRNLILSIKHGGDAIYIKEIDAFVESKSVFQYFQRIIFETFGDYCKKTDYKEKASICVASLKELGFTKENINMFVENNYIEYDTVLVKRHIRYGKTYQANVILSMFFDEGFHFSDVEQLEQFNKYSKELFDEEFVDTANITPKDKHVIQAAIGRADVLLVDRGTYLHKSKCIDLPFDIIENIISYIKSKNRPLNYSEIYEAFRDIVYPIGITNKYMLQGALSKLTGLFRKRRDYISPIEIKQTLRDNMVGWMNGQIGFITYKDFKKEFKGVASSVFMSVIYEVGDFAYYWEKGYIRVSNLNISDERKESLRKLLLYLISQYHMEYCSADEIFNLVNIQMHDFIITNNIRYSYDLFSILQILFKNDFVFQRPLIGSMNAKFENSNEIIDGYLLNKDVVKLSMLRKYLDAKAAHTANDYISIFKILINKRNEFVATDVDTIVRKETININQKDLMKLDILVDLLLDNQEVLNIEEDIIQKGYFKEFAGMPINRYLIFGIINSYLNEKYILEADWKFRGGTFFIKRNK